MQTHDPAARQPPGETAALTCAAIPTCDLLLTDPDPWNLYRRLRPARRFGAVLESRGDQAPGQFSIVVPAPRRVHWVREGTVTDPATGVVRPCPDPLAYLDRFLQDRACRFGRRPAPFAGGAVAFLAYELVRFWERVPVPAAPAVPDLVLLEADWWITIDHAAGRAVLAWLPRQSGRDFGREPAEMEALLADCRRRLAGPAGPAVPLMPPTLGPPAPETSREAYHRMVERAIADIGRGEIYQANLSQSFTGPFAGDPAALYAALRQANPGPFNAFLETPAFAVCSSSPERLVRRRGRTVETRPIAGTRRRGGDQREDAALSTELLLHPKERAEHLMLVDLERNDLGRVCEYGSVLVDELMTVENYAAVKHIVSNVRGTVREGTTAGDLIRAVFPGGTITGVPKVRCMEIIAELEGRSRGSYTGSLGYFGVDGDLDLNILIRTLCVTRDRYTFQVGAGIVADSRPDREYTETLEKAAALEQAIRAAGGNLRARAVGAASA